MKKAIILNEKKCKGCEVIMIRNNHYDTYRFRRKQFHSVECRRKWDKEHGGYGYGSLQEV